MWASNKALESKNFFELKVAKKVKILETWLFLNNNIFEVSVLLCI